MRRRPGWVWGGASVVVVSAVGFAVVVGAAGQRESVLAVVRDVPAGEVIEPGDVREVQVAADAGVVPVAAAETVIGKVAAVPLTAGSLLAPGQVGESAAYPPAGFSEVSFAVAAGDAPPLVKGQRVAVFPGPAATASLVEGGEEAAVEPVVGTVAGVQTDEAGGGPVVVTVLVESVAAERATGVEQPRVVVLTPPDEDEVSR